MWTRHYKNQCRYKIIEQPCLPEAHNYRMGKYTCKQLGVFNMAKSTQQCARIVAEDWAQILTQFEMPRRQSTITKKVNILPMVSAWRIARRAGDTSQSICSLTKGGWKAFSMHWFCFSGGLPLLYQACCIAPLEVKMKNNDNSQHLLDINSILGSGLASYSIWSSHNPVR